MAAKNNENEITYVMPKSIVHIGAPSGRAPATGTRLVATRSSAERCGDPDPKSGSGLSSNVRHKFL